MYKTKLQELCHQKRWGLPKYSTMKDGPDHIPSFKASVTVNGVTFDSPGPCTSSKHAQNQAAMRAFLHFTSSPAMGFSTPTAETDAKEQRIGAARPQDIPIPAVSSVTIDDLNRLYKSQLLNFAQRKNLDLPVFKTKSEGPPHAVRFKATVLVDGLSFESPAFFNTLKEAEQAAAKVALMSLSLDSFQKDDSGLYKNLLQELAQREGFCKPTYKTIKSGTLHMPTFFSTVVVEGKEFHGKAGKSKKQAEQDAAKVAYLALKECGFKRNAAFSSSDFIENKAVESIHSSNNSKSKQNLKHEVPFLSSFAKREDEAQEQDSNEILPTNITASNEISNPSFLQPPEEEDMMSNKSLSSSEAVSESSPKQCPSSPLSQLDLSALSISESKRAKTLEASSYLLCNRVRVYTSYPDISFPEGITVLPISDNRWVAVSLEFPNAKGHDE